MNPLRRLVNALFGQEKNQRSSRAARVRYSVVIEPLEHRTSLSQFHAILPAPAPVTRESGPTVMAVVQVQTVQAAAGTAAASAGGPVSVQGSAVVPRGAGRAAIAVTPAQPPASGKDEPMDPGGVELAIVAGSVATVRVR